MQRLCYNLIKARRWAKLRSLLLLKTFHDELNLTPVDTSCTFLHVACDAPSVPLDIVVSLLEVNQGAAKVEDEDGNLPIHIVCALAPTRPDLIHLLINAYPESSFLPSRDEQELPLNLLVNHCIENKGLKSCVELISSLPPTLIYNSKVSVLHQVSNDLLPEPICHQIIDLYPTICNIRNNGNTLLHTMCSHKNSTSSLIQKIINVCPSNCAIQDDNGNLPLHLVNSQHQPLEILSMLMRCYPHALVVQNNSGQIPLVSPFIRSSSSKVKELLGFCTSTDCINVNAMLQMKSQYGMLPLQDYFYDLQREITSQVFKGTIDMDELSSFGRIHTYNKRFTNHLESFFYLMRVAIYNDVEYNLRDLHQSSFWATFPVFTKTLLNHSPELASHKDCFGNLPLHIISKQEFEQLTPVQCFCCHVSISGPYLWTPYAQNYCKSCCKLGRAHSPSFRSCLIEYQGNELVKDILAINPLAANVTDAYGNLPLHLCLKSAKTWTTGVAEVVEAAPLALGVRDKDTMMLPYMIAAEGKASDSALYPGQKLSTVYELIRRGPSLL